MNKLNNKYIKATVNNIIVALIFILIFCLTIKISFGEKLAKAMSLLNIVTASYAETTDKAETISFNLEKNLLTSYPSYGEKYGVLTIDSIDVKLALCYGSSLDVLKKGVGQTTSSYFPGEGGSIICMAHDTAGFLKYLYTVNIGDQIEIETDYGKFVYEIYETKIVHMSETDAVYLQNDEEILMLYTCYPSDSIGHATHRFITYSKLIEREIY